MKLYKEVVPNPYNDSGYVIIIYKKVFGFSLELGRVLDEMALLRFLVAYNNHNGKEI